MSKSWGRHAFIVVMISAIGVLAYELVRRVPDPGPPPIVTVGPGFIRSYWMRYGNVEIVFEQDDGKLESFTIVANHLPPLWKGMHCILRLRQAEGYSAGYWKFNGVERAGQDAEWHAEELRSWPCHQNR